MKGNFLCIFKISLTQGKILTKIYEENFAENEFESIQLCNSHQKSININDLVTLDDGETIPHNKDFEQSIKVELCDNIGSLCNFEPSFVKTICIQKFIEIGVHVYRKGTNYPELKTVKVPSNCDCVYNKKIWRFW